MTACAGCGRPAAGPEPSLRSGAEVYHLACAPTELLTAASEEYRAILRKGVRYFLEKYGSSPAPGDDPGSDFLALGQAIESERGKRP